MEFTSNLARLQSPGSQTKGQGIWNLEIRAFFFISGGRGNEGTERVGGFCIQTCLCLGGAELTCSFSND